MSSKERLNEMRSKIKKKKYKEKDSIANTESNPVISSPISEPFTPIRQMKDDGKSSGQEEAYSPNAPTKKLLESYRSDIITNNKVFSRNDESVEEAKDEDVVPDKPAQKDIDQDEKEPEIQEQSNKVEPE